MKLNSRTDYALRVLIYLQKNSERVKIQTIATTYRVSKNHLSVVVNRLSDLGYLTNGGIEFNYDRSKTSIKELLVLRLKDLILSSVLIQVQILAL